MSAAEPTTNTRPDLVHITPLALEELYKLWDSESQKEPSPDGLRLGVQGGGCSGFSYILKFDQRKDKDHQQVHGPLTVLIDPKSAIYIKGITLDYQGGLEGKGFVFQNPNATSTCGCGESFSI